MQNTVQNYAYDVQTHENSDGKKAEIITINGSMTQFEVINALYDSCLFSKIKLTATARLVLISMARHYNPANEDFFPSYSCIATHTGVSKKSVERGIKELVDRGLVTYRTKKVNRYRFTGYFFACIKMALDPRQIDDSDMRQNVAQTNKIEKINKKGNFIKNSVEEITSQDNEREDKLTCGEQEQVQINNVNPQIIVIERNPAAEKIAKFPQKAYYNNVLSYNQSANYKRKSGYEYERSFNNMTSHVPTVKETQAYLQELRESRKNACAPIDFEPEKAIAWYNSLVPLLKKSEMAKKVAKKYSLE